MDAELLLPDTGMLYFFYAADQEAWGFDPADRNKFRVIYFDGTPDQLAKIEFPDELPADARYAPCAVEARQQVSLPSYEHPVFDDLTEEETDNLWEMYEDGNVNKLLGYADLIQNEMELECELVTNGLYCGDSSGYNDARAKALESNAKHWRLLLQIDSNDENDMMWGDCGRLYFWIKKDDLFNKEFDKSWLILQCT